MKEKMIEDYLKRVKMLLPLHGKKENDYLKGLKINILDYLEEEPDASEADLYQAFGIPADIVAEYLKTLDDDYLIGKINRQNLLKRCVDFFCILAFCLAAWWSILMYKDYLNFQNTQVTEIHEVIYVGDEIDDIE